MKVRITSKPLFPLEVTWIDGEDTRTVTLTIDQAELIARAARIVREVEAFRDGVEAKEGEQ